MRLAKVCSLVMTLALVVAMVGCGDKGEPAAKKKGEEPGKAEIVVPKDATPKLFLPPLPIEYNTPDGMTLAADGNLYLSVPNFNELRKMDLLFKPEIKEYPDKYPAFIARIDKDNKIEKFSDLPLHPVSKRCGPMGLDQGPDGHLYIADNQYFFDTNHASRLVRVKIGEDGEAAGHDVVVEGFKLSNAVAWKGDHVYVSDTFFDLHEQDKSLLGEDGKPKTGWSGVYRFHIDEFKDGPVKLKPYGTDPHVIAKFETIPNARGDIAGADGMTFDKDGNLYCGNFGDGVISKITFDKDGKVASQKILVKTPTIPSCDGIIYDARTDQIYVTDSQENAVHIIKPDGRFQKIWSNEDTDGSDGLLDQPCEPCLRGDELILVCFDMSFPGLKNSGYDGVNTIHVIDLTPEK
jgi:sugar lactone lactonase YvrE